MRELTVVVGGQYGSEGKGAVVGHLARQMDERDLVIRVGGPNAGHTVVDDKGRTHKLRQLPAAAPVSDCRLQIAAGSEIDRGVLMTELAVMREAGIDLSSRLFIDPNATILTYEHQNIEADLRLQRRIGSTGKGIGAARAGRLMRSADTVAMQSTFGLFDDVPVGRWEPAAMRHVLIEGTQGYGLGLHTPHYPYTTSGDCTAVDFLAQAQVSPWMSQLDRMTVWVVCRVYPIRVAGNSGPLHGETTWQRLGLPEEHTTVTNKVRRVGTWDKHLVRAAVEANGGTPVVRIALMMADQMFPQVKGVTDEDELATRTGFALNQYIESIEQECGALVGLVGTGPETCVFMRED